MAGIKTRSVYSRRLQLVRSSREAALAAIQAYNNPLITFKTETFIVLMMIAWTYLLHAYYRGQAVDYRYFQMNGKRKAFERVDGRFRTWELKRCLDSGVCPLDRDTKNNLTFLIGLRNQIEHSRATELDTFLSGRYQACALNYNYYIQNFFGGRFSVESSLAHSIQFAELSFQQVEAVADMEARIPASLRSYIAQFDNALSDDEFSSERYSYRVWFTKKLTGKRGQADHAIEFIDPNSEEAKTVPQEYWVQKEVEKPKFKASEVVRRAKEAGFASFGMHQHTQLWKSEDARNPAKGLGAEVSGYWYW